MQTIFTQNTIVQDPRLDWKWGNDLLNMYEAFGLKWEYRKEGGTIHGVHYDGEKVIFTDEMTWNMWAAHELGHFIACKLFCPQFINEPNYGYDDPDMMKKFDTENRTNIPGGRLERVVGEITVIMMTYCKDFKNGCTMSEHDVCESKKFSPKLWEYMLSVVPDLAEGLLQNS